MKTAFLTQTEANLDIFSLTTRLAFPEYPLFHERVYPLMLALSEKLFNGACPILPTLVTSISPWGHAIGTCHLSNEGGRASRIWIKRSEVSQGRWPCVLLHEMLHASLSWRDLSTDHNKRPWCSEIVRMTALLGMDIKAVPVTPRKVNGRSVRVVKVEHLSQGEIGSWPDSIGITPAAILSLAGMGPELPLIGGSSTTPA